MSDRNLKVTVESISAHLIALGVAWHLDNGFWSILIDSLLGWVYIAYKTAQFVCFTILAKEGF